MNRKIAASLAATLATAAFLAGAAFAVPTFWSETYAGRIVRTKLHFPCAIVIPRGEHLTCNVVRAKAVLVSARASFAKCQATPPVPGRTVTCYDQAVFADMAATNLAWARNGFLPSRANCIGTGTPDKSGYRFSAFRCVTKVELTVEWSTGSGNDYTITGRIALWPKGRAKAIWKSI